MAAQAFHCTTGLKLFHLPLPVFFILAPLLDRLKKIMRGLLYFIDRRILRNKTGLRSFGAPSTELYNHLAGFLRECRALADIAGITVAMFTMEAHITTRPFMTA